MLISVKVGNFGQALMRSSNKISQHGTGVPATPSRHFDDHCLPRSTTLLEALLWLLPTHLCCTCDILPSSKQTSPSATSVSPPGAPHVKWYQLAHMCPIHRCSNTDRCLLRSGAAKATVQTCDCSSFHLLNRSTRTARPKVQQLGAHHPHTTHKTFASLDITLCNAPIVTSRQRT